MITVYVLMALFFTTKGFQWEALAVSEVKEVCEELATPELLGDPEHSPRFSKGTAYVWKCLPVKMENPERIPSLRHAHQQLDKELNVPFKIGKPHPAFGGGVVTDILRRRPPQPQR
jgi:hypothetical protein